MTFFSGTDISTLKEEGRDRNHFVSLIVNNAGNYTAAITRKVRYVETRRLSYSSFEDTSISDVEETFEELEEMEYFYLDIVFEDKEEYDFTEVHERLKEIKASKEAKIKTPTPTPVAATYIPASKTTPTPSYPSLFNKFNDEDEEDFKSWNSSFGTEDYTPLDIKPTTRAKVSETLIDNLTCQLLTGSVTMMKHDKFDMVKWVKTTMVDLFTKRFGKGIPGLSLFEEWAREFVGFICDNSVETNDRDETEISYLIASRVQNKLRALPQNDYIKTYINLLDIYVEYI